MSEKEDKENKEFLEGIKRLRKELAPLKKYRLNNTCDPHWDMGAIEDMSMLYCFSIFKLKDKLEALEKRADGCNNVATFEYIQKQITELQSKVKLYEATIVGGDFQWLEITKIKKVLEEKIIPALISTLTSLGFDKQCKTIEEGREKLKKKIEEKFKLVKTVRVTPNRGYRTVWQMSFRIPHKVLIDLLGEPSTEEEGMLYSPTLEGIKISDKYIDDLTIGHWYLDVNGEPFRIDLIDPDKLLESKKKNYANPKREEVVYVYGNGNTAVMSFLEMIYSRFGELKIGKWGKK